MEINLIFLKNFCGVKLSEGVFSMVLVFRLDGSLWFKCFLCLMVLFILVWVVLYLLYCVMKGNMILSGCLLVVCKSV